ncbi:MAG: Integrase [Stygiobacter sp.]|nr:MAG: Integrase [Stygiobacter sp.]
MEKREKTWQAEAMRLLEENLDIAQQVIREQKEAIRLKDQHSALERLGMMRMGVGLATQAPDPFAGLHEDARKSLDALLPDFLKDNPQSPKRRAEYEAELARWRRAVGDKSIALVDAMDVAAYHDLLLHEVRPRKGGEIASHDTQHKALSAIRMMLGWACSPTVARRKAGDNPAEKVRPKGVTKRAKNAIKRRPWTPEELKAIFGAPIYGGCLNDLHCLQRGDHDLWWSGRYWLPLVALMSGARIGEIAGLRVCDVSTHGGVTYLAVTTEVSDEDDDEDKARSVKTENSVRMLPVHPELQRLGFLKYIDGISKGKKKSEPLFEKRDYTKFYNNKDRFFDKVGVKSNITSFHSFRHAFKDMLRVLRDSDLRDRLMGLRTRPRRRWHR